MGVVFLLDSSRAVVGPLDPSFTDLSTTRRYWGTSVFSMTISRSVLYADQIAAGCFLYLPDGAEVYLIEQVASDAEGSKLNDLMTVAGRGIEGPAGDRLVIPAPAADYDHFNGPAESAIKHYVDGHAGPSADAARQLPNLVIETDAGRGITVTTDGRYQTVMAMLMEIGSVSGIGWGTTYDPALREFDFDVIVGTDRSASVFFDFDFETLERWTELVSLFDSKTVALVAGQGDLAARDVVIRWTDIDTAGPEPTGFDRREAFVDARDVALGNTGLLDQRGDSAIAANAIARRIEAVVSVNGSFQYLRDWFLGDVVLARNVARGLSYSTRIVEVTRKWAASQVAPDVKVALDKPLPTLKDRVATTSTATGPIVDLGGGGGGGGLTNLDGGLPDTVYGGTTAVDGGAP